MPRRQSRCVTNGGADERDGLHFLEAVIDNLLAFGRGRSTVAIYGALLPTEIHLDDMLGARFVEQRLPRGIPAQGNADD